MPAPRPQPGPERGFALLLVVWVLAILAVLAAGFAASTRSETRLAHNLVETARARALAEAGVAEAMAGVLDPNPLTQWPADGRVRDVIFGGGVIRLRLQDEGGKIDVNSMPLDLLAGLCAELGIDSGVKAALIDAVTARRAAVPGPGNGAPIRVGPGANLNLNSVVKRDPQSVAFGTVDELRQIPGLDRASFERLRPFLTVYSQSPVINPNTASREVLLAVPRLDPHQVDQFLAARASAAATGAPPPFLTGGEGFVGAVGLRAVTVIAEATTLTGASFARRMVVGLTNVPLSPVQVLEWRQVVDVETGEPASP
jgi:general secretion pathway protein K